MRFTQISVLAYASVTMAAPAFTLPAFTWGGFGLPKKTTTSTTAIASPTPAPSTPVAPVIVSTSTPAAISTSKPPTTTSSTPAKTSSSAAPAQTPPSQDGCTFQGAGGGNTENGVVNGNCCTDVTIVFARGTGEGGNVGAGAGPPMFKSLRAKIGNNRVTVQGVDYPADSAGNSNQGGTGGATMASNVKQALSQCPNTKIVVSGYSQGGMVVHNAFSKQGLSSAQVSAAVQFGDPQNGQAVGDLPASKVLQDCHDGDHVCDGSGTFAITSAHTNYGQDADKTAQFIIDTLGL